MLYLIKKCFISTRRYERNVLELLKYKYLENDLKSYRQHRHDMKNHLSIIYDLVQGEKYDDLKNYTKEYLHQTVQKLKTVSSGSDEIDVLLYHKINQAKEHHIPVDYHIKTVFNLPYAAMMDFVSIFSNLLDNGIEANVQLKDIKDRTLNITIDDDAIDYKIVITNAFKKHSKPQKFLEDGFTTKDNKENHGLGLGIVEKIVQRYKGQSHIEILNESFYQVKIEIPKHEVH
jgi:two-component system sensor histidine kinase AgrC